GAGGAVLGDGGAFGGGQRSRFGDTDQRDGGDLEEALALERIPLGEQVFQVRSEGLMLRAQRGQPARELLGRHLDRPVAIGAASLPALVIQRHRVLSRHVAIRGESAKNLHPTLMSWQAEPNGSPSLLISKSEAKDDTRTQWTLSLAK